MSVCPHVKCQDDESVTCGAGFFTKAHHLHGLLSPQQTWEANSVINPTFPGFIRIEEFTLNYDWVVEQ